MKKLELTQEQTYLTLNCIMQEMRNTFDMINCCWLNADLTDEDIQWEKEHLEKLELLYNTINETFI